MQKTSLVQEQFASSQENLQNYFAQAQQGFNPGLVRAQVREQVRLADYTPEQVQHIQQNYEPEQAKILLQPQYTLREKIAQLGNKKYLLLLLAVIILIPVGFLLLTNQPQAKESSVTNTQFGQPVKQIKNGAVKKPVTVSEKLYVHVVGAVKKPGIYKLDAQSRVADALKAAGEATAEADLAMVNLARKIVDGEQILVPDKNANQNGDPAAGAGQASTSAGAISNGKVNLNRATVSELETLPKIGKITAQNIVTWRDKNGPFQNIEQLQEISGIGPKMLAGLKEQVTL